ncbi:hypothetical protein RHOSPDRAFT_35168 [Rhodotorula sp. JG-1b]|nr:hypothetical protein RHOSPDRAFT_35168 [Rhodotorula sp. JG-1b]
MPIALARYLEPYGAYLRPLGYYATWTIYFLSFAVSPGLVTVLQALCLVLSWILPSVELNVERGRRQILASRWIRPEWAWSDGVPAHQREWPLWAQNAASHVDVRPTLAVGWNACAAKLRALGRRMGWDAKRPQPTGARRATNFALHPPTHASAVRPASLAPSARSNPFASPMPPRSASLGAIPSRDALSAHAAAVQVEHGSIAGSLRSRASNPFSVAGHSARSISTRAPQVPLREGVAGRGAPAWSVASAQEAAAMQENDGSFWSDGGSWNGT